MVGNELRKPVDWLLKELGLVDSEITVA